MKRKKQTAYQAITVNTPPIFWKFKQIPYNSLILFILLPARHLQSTSNFRIKSNSNLSPTATATQRFNLPHTSPIQLTVTSQKPNLNSIRSGRKLRSDQTPKQKKKLKSQIQISGAKKISAPTWSTRRRIRRGKFTDILGFDWAVQGTDGFVQLNFQRG